VNSAYSYDASMPSPPDPDSPDYAAWQKLQRQKVVADAMAAQLAQPQGAQQHPMAAGQSPLGAMQPMAQAFINNTLRQRQQQALQANGAGLFGSSGMGYGTIDPTMAGEGLPY
jgi:hypothetical protein